jgi:hypothetical protein
MKKIIWQPWSQSSHLSFHLFRCENGCSLLQPFQNVCRRTSGRCWRGQARSRGNPVPGVKLANLFRPLFTDETLVGSNISLLKRFY